MKISIAVPWLCLEIKRVCNLIPRITGEVIADQISLSQKPLTFGRIAFRMASLGLHSSRPLFHNNQYGRKVHMDQRNDFVGYDMNTDVIIQHVSNHVLYWRKQYNALPILTKKKYKQTNKINPVTNSFSCVNSKKLLSIFLKICCDGVADINTSRYQFSSIQFK